MRRSRPVAAAERRSPSVRSVTASRLRAWPLPQPGADGDKEERGRVLVVGGSTEVPGAILLAGVAALRAGAGKLQLATSASAAVAVGVAVPEARVIALAETDDGQISPAAAARVARDGARVDALLLGPGFGGSEAAGALVRDTLRALADAAVSGDGPTVVLDAGALAELRSQAAVLRRFGRRLILTPHAGEMATLLGTTKAAVEKDPLAVATTVSAELQAVVALKGADTMIVSPDGRQLRYGGGRVGLATSGSGDTLAGIVAGLAARGAEPLQAAAWAAYLHGVAGNALARRRGPLGFLARELLEEIPKAMAAAGRRLPGRG